MSSAKIGRLVGGLPPTVSPGAARESVPDPGGLSKSAEKSQKSVKSRRNLEKQLGSATESQNLRASRTDQSPRLVWALARQTRSVRAAAAALQRGQYGLNWRHGAQRPPERRSCRDLEHQMALRAARARMESLSDEGTVALANAAYKREWAPNPESVTLSCASAAD